MGSIPTYLLANTLTALVLYAVGLATTRSRLFSVSVAVAFSTSTFNYHVYVNSGTNIVYPFIIFGSLALCAQAMYVRSVTPRRRLLTLSAMLLFAVAFALTYESWLDIVPWLVVVSPVAWWYANQRFGSQAGRRYIESVILWLIVAVVYIGIRTNPANVHTFQPGSEVDLIVTYLNQYSPAPFLDDLVSNVFTFFYAAFSTLLPPGVGESITLLKHSRAEIDGFMQGYHAPANHLVYPHYIYLWRYFAGAAFAMAAVLAWNRARRTLQDADTPAFLLFIGLIALILGSPTHDIIKFRPYNATPFLGYKSVFAVGGCLLSSVPWP